MGPIMLKPGAKSARFTYLLVNRRFFAACDRTTGTGWRRDRHRGERYNLLNEHEVFAMKLAAIAVLLTVVPGALAQSSGGDFEITRSVIGAGGSSSGGDFTLTGTIGQPVVATSQGGQFSLSGGFWTPGQRPDLLFSNGFE